jgi:hypothetical protein
VTEQKTRRPRAYDSHLSCHLHFLTRNGP